MSQDNDTAEDHLHVKYELEGAFQLEAFEFGKLLIPFLKDESTESINRFINMLKSYDTYVNSRKHEAQSAARLRLDYILNEAWEDEHFLDLFRDKEEVINALSEDL